MLDIHFNPCRRACCWWRGVLSQGACIIVMTSFSVVCSVQRAVAEENESKPQRLPDDSLAFMFESCFTPRVSTRMLKVPYLDTDYYKCWQGLRSHFSPAIKKV